MLSKFVCLAALWNWALVCSWIKKVKLISLPHSYWTIETNMCPQCLNKNYNTMTLVFEFDKPTAGSAALCTRLILKVSPMNEAILRKDK